MENLYIAYQDDSVDVFLVKAKNKGEAIDIVYQTYIEPFQTNEYKKREYKLYLKSELRVKTPEELLGDGKITMLT